MPLGKAPTQRGGHGVCTALSYLFLGVRLSVPGAPFTSQVATPLCPSECALCFFQTRQIAFPTAAMAPLVEQSHRNGPPNLPLLTQRACGELQAAAQQHLQRAEAWLKHVGASIASSNPALRQLLQQVEDFKVGVQLNRASSNQLVVRNRNFAAIIPGDSVAEMVISSSVYNFLNIYNTVLIARLVLTWFPSAPEFIVNPLSTICDPYLNVFRGIIPPLGTIDLSPILAFTILNVFTSTAQALPCELDHKPREKLGWRQLAQRKKGLKGSVSK